MATTQTLRAADNRVLVTEANIIKRLDTRIKGMENELSTHKTGFLATMRGLFSATMVSTPPDVVSNYKVETTKETVVDGVPIEVPDGVVQCQMKVIRKSLTAGEIELARTAGAAAESLVQEAVEVDLVDTVRVLRFLAANPHRVAITPSGDTIVLSLLGGVAGVDGVSTQVIRYPAEKFLDKVQELTLEQRGSCMGYINSVLTRMLSPVLVLGNRTSTGAGSH